MQYRAYAKVNLSLEVLGPRSDGYHDLATVMQSVNLHDDLEIHEQAGLHFECSDPALVGDDNLVVRAAQLLKGHANGISGCSLALRKAIPHAAGLGGGSSDAATTLRALNVLWSLGWSREQLAQLGAQLGSDVPFFLHGGTALVKGRGEIVKPLPDPEPTWYALVKPAIEVPTAAVFKALTAADWTDGSSSEEVAQGVCERRHTSIGVNGLQRALFDLFPLAEQCFTEVSGLAPGRAFISGSGPTVGVLCERRFEAECIAQETARDGWWSVVAHSIGRVEG